jgi:hypothetical protein
MCHAAGIVDLRAEGVAHAQTALNKKSRRSSSLSHCSAMKVLDRILMVGFTYLQ